jgi:hypothetical protein
MMARHVRVMPPLLILALLAAGITSAQQPGPQAPPAPVGAAPLTALVDQLVNLFPKLEGEVVEVRDGALTLGANVKAGARPGLEVELFREGREIKHPKTGAVLGHVLKNGKPVTDKAVRVPGSFRPMGAAFSNVMGKDTRSLALIDESNRLQIVNEGEELWHSATSVGGGYMTVELVGAVMSSKMDRSKGWTS